MCNLFYIDGRPYLSCPKYLAGDFVKFKGKIYELYSVSEQYVKIFFISNKGKGKFLEVRINDITPIPLTENFFIENKWELVIRDDIGHKYVYRKKPVIIEYDKAKDEFHYYKGMETLLLKSISDLQHLFFALKLCHNNV